MSRALGALLPLVVAAALSPTVAGLAPAASEPTVPAGGTWSWPVVGPVIRAFDPPQTPFGAGHRGIDIAVPLGTPVVAAEAGVVTFAGRVGGELFVTVDHGGVSSTYSWLSERLVAKGDVVARGTILALSGAGHPGSTVPHLHFGVRQGDVYLDPLEFLGPVSVSPFIRLAPLEEAT